MRPSICPFAQPCLLSRKMKSLRSSVPARFCLAAICCTALAGATAAYGQQNKPPTKPKANSRTTIPAELIDRLESHHDIVYARYGERTLELDLYRPKNAAGQKLPAIVCIHGGGWWQGTRVSQANLARALADRGFVTATISYRLSGEAPFPAAIHDCKAAVRFLRANADTYGIDADHIGATGLSAGGHLTALLGTSADLEELEGDGGNGDFSSRIQAAVPLGAQTNFRSHYQNIHRTPPPAPGGKPNIWVQFLDGTPAEAPERYRLASPISHLDPADPPMHFFAGEHDAESTHAEVFRKKMRELGIAEDLTILKNAPHAFLGGQRAFDEMLEQAAAWFTAYLK